LNIAAVVAYVVSTSILNILNDPERMHEIWQLNNETGSTA
jgi:hypothetical protein